MLHFECNCGPCEADLAEILSLEDNTPIKCQSCESAILLVYSGKENGIEDRDEVQVDDVGMVRKYVGMYVGWTECARPN